MTETPIPIESSASPQPVTADPTSGRDRIFLFVALLFLAGTIWWVARPSGIQRYHLIITGVGKGRITPFISRFDPYKDKKMGGAEFVSARISELISGFKGEACNVVSLGNELSGSPETYFTKGEAAIEALNSYRLDAMLAGNIDFSFGTNRLAELAGKARFPFLAANVTEEGSGQPPSWLNSERIFSHGSNLHMAFIGICPPKTPVLTAKGNVSGLSFVHPGPAIASRITALRTGGADIVVLLTLYDRGKLTPDEWASLSHLKPDIILMIDFNAEAPAPMMLDGILVKTVNGYNQGSEIDLLHLDLEPGSPRIASFSSTRLPILSDEITPDPEVASAVKSVAAKIEQMKSERVVDFASDFQREYNQECPIGNLVADSMRFLFKTDLALQNSGGIQSNIRKGSFTLGDLYDVLPFDNDVVAIDLTGQDLLELLTLSSSLKRGCLQISGGSYVFSNRNPDDFELKSVTIGGAPLVATRTYRITTNSFLADGGDEYRQFKHGRNLQIGPQQREVVRSYLRLIGASTSVSLATTGRIIRE
ncbi:MAG: bifunctional metallophosphatase/5'-nucleotidase [Candidatus Riflebacteria bacterium]|nr:bifunctional metallophosphatase/5'-nucleotidase [Candidatus Riflebacteria bacterium]